MLTDLNSSDLDPRDPLSLGVAMGLDLDSGSPKEPPTAPPSLEPAPESDNGNTNQQEA